MFQCVDSNCDTYVEDWYGGDDYVPFSGNPHISGPNENPERHFAEFCWEGPASSPSNNYVPHMRYFNLFPGMDPYVYEVPFTKQDNCKSNILEFTLNKTGYALPGETIGVNVSTSSVFNYSNGVNFLPESLWEL